MITGTSWSEMGIDIPGSKLGSTSNIKVKQCPKCLELGHRKDNDYSLSVIPADGVGKCHKCNSIFKIIKEEETKRVEYKQPSRANFAKLSEAGTQFFVNRHISKEAVEKHKIVEDRKGNIAFPYLENGQIINAKYRGITEKKFYQSAGAKQIMYNMDNVRESWLEAKHKSLIICEGEFDSLAWETAGIPYSTSVSQGAPNVKDENVDKKLECITNSYELFDEADTIYIGVDNDANGKRLERELIRRFPYEKVRIIDYGSWKDANDYLKWEGKEALVKLISEAQQPKIEGIFTAEDSISELQEYLEKGLPKGTTTYFPSIDKHWKWRSDVNLVTGYNNEGKSLMMLQLAIVKAKRDGWKFAIFSPENLPQAELWEDMAHAYSGKSMDTAAGKGQMDEKQLLEAVHFLKEHFFLVSPEEGSKVETLIEKFKNLVHTKGIRGIIIDPYNQIEHRLELGETEHLYASRFMSILKAFQVQYKICIILVMHMITPRNVAKDDDYPEPDRYGIKGGGTFSDKADNVLIVWRPNARTNPLDPLVMFKSDKIKKVKLTGHRGACYLSYDWKTNRYIDPELNNQSPLAIQEIPKDDGQVELVMPEPERVDPMAGEEFEGPLPF